MPPARNRVKLPTQKFRATPRHVNMGVFNCLITFLEAIFGLLGLVYNKGSNRVKV